MNLRYLALLPIPILIILISIFQFHDSQSVSFLPQWIFITLNTLFISLISFVVAVIAGFNYRATGKIQVLLLGCGVLSLGIGTTLGGLVVGFADGVNLSVTTFNIGAFTGAIFHFTAAIIYFFDIHLKSGLKSKDIWLITGYSGVIIFMLLLTMACLHGIIPTFFIQGQGPTIIRQIVLGLTINMFIFSILTFFSVYRKNEELFMYWYSLAILLATINFVVALFQKYVGNPVGWVGRVSLYVGGIYFFIAILTAVHSAATRKKSFSSIISSSMSQVEEKFRMLAENVPDVIDRLDRNFRHIYLNQAGLRVYTKPAHLIIGKTIKETGVPEPYCSLWMQRIQKVFNTGEQLDTEDYFPAADGLKYFHSHFVPELGADNSVFSVLVVSRDLTDLKRIRDYSRGLIEINTIIHSALDFNIIMDRVITKAAEIMVCETAVILFRTGEAWEVRFVYGYPKEIIGMKTDDREEPPALLAVRSREVVTIDDAFNDERANRDHMKKWGVRSTMVVPVIADEKTTGVIFFNYNKEIYRFTGIDTDFGNKLASSVSLAVRNASLFENLRESEKKFLTIFQTTPVGLSLAGLPEGRLHDVNKAWLDITGFANKEEVIGKTSVELGLIPVPEIRKLFLEEFIKKGYALNREMTFRNKAGIIRTLVINIKEIEIGGRKLMLSTNEDITERKQIENALRRSEQKWITTLSSIGDAVIAADVEGRVTFMNNVSENLTGWKISEAAGKPITDVFKLVNEQTGLKAENPVEKVLRDRMSVSLINKMILIKKDGTEVPVDDSGSPIKNRDGETEGVVLIFRDISERRRAEKLLFEAQNDLERRVQERTFELKKRTQQLRALTLELSKTESRERKRLAGILHDHLQQLLVGAKLGNEAIIKEISDNSLKNSVQKVSDLLDESIKVSRSLSAELSPPVLYDSGLVPGLRWLARWLEEKQNFKVNIISEVNIPPDAEGISLLLFQSIRELLLNVIKHAKVKEANVKVSITEDNMILSEIEDKGVGFDPSQVEKRGSEAGFGLFSIKERIDFLGGKMHIDSLPGRGTCVTIKAPLPTGPDKEKTIIVNEAASTGTMNTDLIKNAPKIRVLVADDHAVVREGFVSLVRNEPDMEVVGEASNGEEAVNLTRELHPDVVIMDVSMPKMSGIEATKKIKSELQDTKVIGLSMYEEDEEGREMMNAGASAYLTKDGPSKDLLEEIRSGNFHYEKKRLT